MVGEGLVDDRGLNFGQQAAADAAAVLARFGRRAAQEAASAPRVPGSWTFGDHDVVFGSVSLKRKFRKFKRTATVITVKVQRLNGGDDGNRRSVDLRLQSCFIV